MARAVVLEFPRSHELEATKPRPFGQIWRRKRSTRLWVRFTYHDRTVEKSLGIETTAANEARARAFLDRIGEAIQAGTFRFADAFPGAPEEEKAWFAEREGWEHGHDPRRVLFGDYLSAWLPHFLETEPSANKRRDYERHIQTYIRPYFASLPFAAINGVRLKDFCLGLRRQSGPRKGQLLSGSSVRNILTVFRAVWDDAWEEYGWRDLHDPLEYVKRRNRKNQIIQRKRGTSPEAFRCHEWQTLLGALEPWYQPIAELMVLTGMIASELAGLQRGDIQENRIVVQRSILRGVEKSALKTEFRARQIPVTAAIGKRLEVLQHRAKGKYLVQMETGAAFDADNFRKNAWTRAFRRAGLPYRKPYATRHTFAAWSLIVGVHPERLVRLMGHGSKRMVYDVYGMFVEGLDVDRDRIQAYLGDDYR